MNSTDNQEIWQIDVGNQVYEATFDVLAQWIGEGSLLPQDKVRRGNLRWIEARRVPSLVPFFNAKETGAAPPVVTSTDGGDPATTVSPTFNAIIETPPVNAPAVQHTPPSPAAATANDATPVQVLAPEPTVAPTYETGNVAPDARQSCSMHPSSAAFFVCDTCANVFCKLCPKSYGGTVRICPFCGAMCQRIDQSKERENSEARIRSDVSAGFGFGDFTNALAYPFRYKSSLLFGAVMFMIFTIGQGASSFGGIFLLAASLMCYMLANMLYFGILTNVLENFSQGFTDRNFMPSFDDFSLWDDVVHPFFLSIAVYIVSFGLLFVVVGATVLYAVKTVSNQAAPTPISAQQNPLAGNPDFEKFNEAFAENEMPGEDRINGVQRSPNDEEERFRKLNEFIQEQRKKQLEAGIGKSPETLAKERNEMVAGFFKVAVPLLLLAGLALLWGFFYLPAACLVAGYTRSFVATLNPKIGLETIRILGFDYVKILLMGIMIGIASGVVGVVLGIIFLPFDMPSVGNLPAKAIGALASFYLSVVFSIVLGYALYKNSEKLQLFRG